MDGLNRRLLVRFGLVPSWGAVALADGRVVPAAARVGRAAAVPTVAALGLLAVLAAGPAPPAPLPGDVGPYLVLLSVLMPAHAAVATWMDAAQGVWDRSGEG